MKKLFIAMSLCATLILAASPLVYAHDMGLPHYDFCGYAHPLWVELRDSNSQDIPNDDCVAWIDFDLVETDQDGHAVCRVGGLPDGEIINCWEGDVNNLVHLNNWKIYAEAFGTQINLALVKAINHGDYISLCFAIYFDKDGYHARIWRVDFGWDPPAPSIP
jgi:hypothetical protein